MKRDINEGRKYFMKLNIKPNRILSSSLVLCMALTILAGCAGKDGINVAKGKDESGSNISGTSNISVDSNAASTGKSNPISNGSSNITSSGTTGNNSSASKPVDTTKFPNRASDLKGRTLTIPGSEETLGTVKNKLSEYYSKLTLKIETSLNCKIKYIRVDQQQITISIQAGKPIVDIWWIPTIGEFISAYSAGQLTNLTALKAFDTLDRKKYTDLSDIAKIGNDYYGLQPNTYGSIPYFTANVMVANLDILKNVGVTESNLKQWQESGQWTWDKFEEVAKKVKNNTGGYNKYAIGDAGLRFYQALMNANETDWITRDSKSQLSFTGDTAKSVKVLNKYVSWAKDGLIDMVEDTSSVPFATGKTAFMSQQMFTMLYGTPTFNFAWMLPPKGPDANDYKLKTTYASFVVIPKGTKPSGCTDAEIATVYDSLYDRVMTDSESNSMIIPELSAAIKNDLAKTTVNRIVSYGPTKMSWACVTQGIGIMYGTDGWLTQVKRIANNTTTLAQAVGRYKSKYNSLLKNVYRIT